MYVSGVVLALFSLACPLSSAVCQEDVNPVSRVKITKEHLSPGMEIAEEVWATDAQLTRKRMRMGFPLNALLNQAIIYGAEQATVNYLAVPGEDWLQYCYTKLIGTDGLRSLVLRKGDIIIQMAASTRDLEDTIVRVLKPDPLQGYKIRINHLPKEWACAREEFLPADEMRSLERRTEARIEQGLVQEFVVNRETVTMRYYHSETPAMAERVARQLAGKKTSLIERQVQLSGTVIVVSESQNPDLIERAMRLVNW
jgi:hypothetical protein